MEGTNQRGAEEVGPEPFDWELPLHRSEQVQWRSVGEEVLIVQREFKQYHSLNRTAACIWSLCDGVATPAEVAAELARRHAPCGVTEGTLRQDVQETMEGLRYLGLLQSAPSV